MASKSNKAQSIGIAIDIGYGYTKAMATNGNRDMQHTAYCYMPHNLTGDELENEQAHFPSLTSYESEDVYLTGNMAEMHAESQDRLIRLSSRDNTDRGNEIRLRMVRMAAARLLSDEVDGEVVHAEIVTGLPVNYLRDRVSLKNMLIGQHRVQTDHADFVLNVTSARVLPQPMGTVYAYRLATDGSVNDFNYKKIVVFDFGTLTSQVVTHDISRGAQGGYIGAQSFSADAGAHIIREEVLNFVEKEFGDRNISVATVEDAIKTGVLKTGYGESSVIDEIDKGARQMIDIIERKAGKAIGKALEADAVIVTGGIASRMYPYIVEQYGGVRTFMANDPQWSNVLGYSSYLKFQTRQMA